MTTVYFIRHGESVTNLDKRFTGQLDAPLTEKGRAQAELTGEFLRDVPFTACYSSDLQRAYDTAVAVADFHHIPVVGVPALREIDCGKWTGIAYDDLARLYPEDYHRWRTEIGLATCTGGESMMQLQQRALQAIQHIVSSHPDETVCVTSHGGVVRVLLAYYAGIKMEDLHKTPNWVSNASVSIVEFDERGRGYILQRDLHEHLGLLNTEPPKAI